MANSRPSNPVTPSKSRVVTKTSTRTVEERTPDKTIIRTKTHSSRLEIVKTPTVHTLPTIPGGVDGTSSNDSDPNEDATITFATDSEDETSPPSVFLSTRTHASLSPSISSVSSLSMSSVACPSKIPDSDRHLSAYYEARYPGKIPHPSTLTTDRTNFSPYYVVFAGLSVGIYDDWDEVSDLVTGVSHAKHRSYPRYYHAWLAYFKAYHARRLRVLGRHQDTAPVEHQIVDSGLESGFANISFSSPSA
ncbi:hypothetical protein V5O48_015660 [Marasmius crinis-equi]|uniref:Ribonuclease H1 N-terminal domain-containing protein n=1 Tax=Marasmius crinis-equi TaxID=585013 RepID=A0ABR3ETW8_9AGAR